MSWALGSGTILQGVNSSIVAVALVSIAAWFGDSSSIPWLVSGMYIAAAVASPTAGRLADLFGPRRMYLVGLVIVLAAAVAGPFVPSVEWLIADRVLMGVGASIHFPAAMAIIRRQAELRQADSAGALGVIALCGQTVAALGPTIGGILVLFFGWQGIFWINVPLVLNSFLWVVLTVPADAPTVERRTARKVFGLIDVPGLVLFVAALVVTMLGLLALADLESGDLGSLLFLASAVPLWALFAWRELRARTPFVDVRMLAGHRELLATCGRAVITFVAFYCVFYGLPQWYELSRNLTPAGAGLLMLPVFGVGVLSTVIAARASRRLRPRVMLLIGSGAFVLAGGLVASLLTSDAPYWLLIVVGALFGIPNGFNNLGNQIILHASSPAGGAGVASGLYRTSQYIGASLSAVVVTALLVPALADGGIRLLGAAIAAIGLLLFVLSALALLRSRRATA